MKAGLKRIEATLHDLGNRDMVPPESETRMLTGETSGSETSGSSKRPLSFRISVGPAEDIPSDDGEQKTEGQTVDVIAEFHSDNPDAQNLFTQHTSVQTFPAQENGGKVPSLPKFKTPSFSNHRNAANPGLALGILKEIQEHVAPWYKEQQKIVQQIQNIYLEGPIVNGWLESLPKESKEPKEPKEPKEEQPGGTATLRHAEVDRLMDYVEEICATQAKEPSKSARTGYRLCGLDASGQVWSRPCPPEQVPSVSMAIARYQKLRQLLGRKQYLENRLHQLAETLVVLHAHIQQT
jgi:chemotaxis protein histidine kinase CheA